ncbi:MAG: ABC transporter ATP-binding protein [Pseudomonadota bacterium]
MIRLVNLSKSYFTNGVRKTVLQNVNLTFPTGRSVALLGRNGAGKSTLLRMISGTLAPTGGRIEVTGSISWPVGFMGSFHPDLTGAQNTRFVARVYGVDSDELCDFASDFAQLGRQFHAPFRTYSTGMRSRLAFGVSMGISFDTYLVDEVTAAGDASFRERSTSLFRQRMAQAGAVMVSHSMSQVRELCNAACVLDQGSILWFEDVEEAIAHHEDNMLG